MAKSTLSKKYQTTVPREVREKLGLEHRTDYVRFAIESGILGP